MRNRFFTQYELEFAIEKCLEHGDDAALAEALGVSPGIVSQYLNKNDLRESPIYKAACIFAEWIHRNPENGKAALDVFCYFVRRSLPGKDLCIDRTREKAFREDVDFKLASVNGDIDTQIRELEESIAADAEHLEALRGEKKRQIKTEVFKKVEARFNGKSVSTNGGRR